MTKPQQLIREILDAAATGKLEDAEKAIEEYVKDVWDAARKDGFNIAKGVIISNMPDTEKYFNQQYINQK